MGIEVVPVPLAGISMPLGGSRRANQAHILHIVLQVIKRLDIRL